MHHLHADQHTHAHTHILTHYTFCKETKHVNVINIVPLSVQILGTPTEETWPGITKNTEFVNGHFPIFHAEPLDTHAPRLDTEAIDLLEKLLQFESKNRVSALEAMRHPYFESLGPRVHQLPNSELVPVIFSHTTVKISSKTLPEAITL